MSISSVLKNILSGPSSDRAMGFLFHLPKGFSFSSHIEAALAAHYGSLAHPDLRILAPAGASSIITVDVIRDALPFLSATSAGKGLKTLLIREAGRMNLAAANALLKSLEEPTASTRILLVADEISALPATILSRCNRIRITANAVDGEKEVVGLLAMHHEDHLEVRPEEVRSALSLAGGSPRDAVSVITHDLLPWANKVAKWLSSPGTTAPPLPTTSGKSAASIESCGIVLHSMLHGSLLQQLNLEGPEKSEVSLSGWPIERLVAASKKLSDELMRLRRPGLDVKLRLHSILIELSRIESE